LLDDSFQVFFLLPYIFLQAEVDASQIDHPTALTDRNHKQTQLVGLACLKRELHVFSRGRAYRFGGELYLGVDWLVFVSTLDHETYLSLWERAFGVELLDENKLARHVINMAVVGNIRIRGTIGTIT
jgi:hypothetical protein